MTFFINSLLNYSILHQIKYPKLGIRGKNNNCKEKPLLLFSALDWGLGHTTRSIPLIREFLEQGCEIVIACNSIQKKILEVEFPTVRYENLPGYDLRYANAKWATRLVIGLQLRKILIRINQENRWVAAFIRENPVCGLISDNRYGFFHAEIPSVLITHQVAVKTGLGRMVDNIARSFLTRYINRFDECWIPDVGGEENLAGELSRSVHKYSVATKYVGPLSRLEICNTRNEIKFDVLVVLSGPEPQRSVLERMIFNEASQVQNIAVVRGLPGDSEEIHIPNVTVFNFLNTRQLNEVICNSAYIVCRSGYTSIMDLVKLQKKMILVPTPGQAEQEYLAKHLSQQKLACAISQRHFKLREAIELAKHFQYEYINNDMTTYKNVVRKFVERISS